MGILDDVMGGLASANDSAPRAEPEPDPGLLAGILGMVQGPQLGGLAGIVRGFEQNGLGDMVGSWVSTGPNPPATERDITQGLGMGQILTMAKSLGITPQMLLPILAAALPKIIDMMTPDGRVPESSGDLGGGGLGDLLGGLLGRR